MASNCYPLLVCLLMIPFLFFAPQATVASTVGVNYGRDGDNLPSPTQVVNLLKSNNIQKAKIFDAASDSLSAFSGSGISLIVAVGNDQLQSISSSQSSADQWVQQNIVPYASAAQIKYITVGNEVLINNPGYTQYLVPAIQNIYNSLGSSNLQGSITVSTTHSTGVLDSNSYPPSNGNFQSGIQDQMRSILSFLHQTGAPFMASVYPFFAYRSSNGGIDLQYALFGQANGIDDSGLHYSNLFDAQVDTLIAAMSNLGYSDIPILVSETGWPSQGDPAATVDNARTYNSNLVGHVSGGTPKRPGVAIEAYIFSLFNEDSKTGDGYEKFWGLFNADQSKVYDITF